MNRDLILASLVVVLGASGTYLLLPHKHGLRKPRNVHIAGAAIAGLAVLLFVPFLTPPGSLFALSSWFFYAFAFASLAGGVLTVTTSNPIHSALWFASVVLSTSGLFLLAGAQFLAAGTVIVYAGAIVVTFLFVIMLAQMEGKASYDRAARMPFRATWVCFLLFFGLLYALLQVREPKVNASATPSANAPSAFASDPRLPRATEIAARANPRAGRPVAEVLARANRTTAQLLDARRHPKPHVAGLGETLYTDHLVTVELAGALLFVALIGAVAIASPKPPVRPGETRTSVAAEA